MVLIQPMKKCLKCGGEFNTKISMGGKCRNLQNRKFCLTCSPFLSHNTIDITKRPKDTKCEVCAAFLKGSQTKFCSTTCKRKHFSATAPSTYVYQQGRAIERKLIFTKLLGGKCEECGYDKNLASLVFHHINASEKGFSVDARKMSNTKMTTLLEEVKKCKLLCHNCHNELHYPHLDLALITSLKI